MQARRHLCRGGPDLAQQRVSGSSDPGDADMLNALDDLIEGRRTRELDPVELERLGHGTADDLRRALETLADAGRVERAEAWICPAAHCGRAMSDEERLSRVCPYCETDFRETGDEPFARTVYRVPGELSRDIEWMVVIHGMNTFGPWQEDLSWRLSNKLRYSAPVLIYKYGMVRLGVLLRFRHRQLVQALGRKLRRAAHFAAEFRRKRAPDVILHSFGTLLFARLLEDPQFGDLKFGRVILAGSIVRPDHRWARFVDSGRVEAVLNHCGGRDKTVELADAFIPGSGPSGRRGFVDGAVFSLVTPDYDHSTFFEPKGLDESLTPGGLWDRFLRLPLSTFEPARMEPAAAAWRPLFGLVQPCLAILVLLLATALAAVVLAGLVSLASGLVHGR